MTQLLVEGMTCSLDDAPLENHQNCPEPLQPLIDSQEAIGWDQLFHGRLSTKWMPTHRHHFQNNGCTQTRQNSGIQWLTKIMKITWTHSHKMWTARNKKKHGQTLAEQLETQRQLCVAEVTLYYQYHTDGLLHNSIPEDIFYRSLSEHLRKEASLTELDTWLVDHRQIILDSKARQEATGTALFASNNSLSENNTPGEVNRSTPMDGVT